ncbi:uncharacterized protein LOC115175631 isoform X1 [Salmo trutta]|uniref:uncharacterized protein LOC115175631 isoform X1 n=1 Tax=Salmo trutta TaxID=8032 RepID=UPI00113299BF|nr:uncharacterized protein LOC115175631 isoform X1 [Salmo trutta]
MRRSHKQGREHSAGIAGYKIKVLWLEDVDQCLYSRGRLFSVRMDSGIVRAFLQCQTEDGDIRCVSDKVTAHCNKRISLNKPKGYKLKIGHQDDTVYKGNKKVIEELSKFYLKEEVKMVVIGVIDGFDECEAESGQLLILVGEDWKVYAYETECLHLVAKSMQNLFESGLNYPGIKTFYRGQCFENMTPEEWSDVERDSDEIQKKQDAHKCFLKSTEEEFLRNLEIIKRKLPTQNKKMPERQCERATVEDPKKKLRSNCDHLCLSSLI